MRLALRRSPVRKFDEMFNPGLAHDSLGALQHRFSSKSCRFRVSAERELR
jgi:hypothetical protein